LAWARKNHVWIRIGHAWLVGFWWESSGVPVKLKRRRNEFADIGSVRY
jgi:hypothetical protein